MRNQKKQANVDNSGGDAMSRANANSDEAASRLLSSELGFDWDRYIEETLQPITARLQEELPRLIQPELERLQSIVKHAEDELVAPVKETLAQQVGQVLTVLRGEPAKPAKPETRSERRTSGSTVQAKPRSKPAARTPAQPPPGPARRRAPSGQPPPGPARRRPPASSAPKTPPSQ